MTTNNPYGYTKDIENQINLIKDESAKNVISRLYKYASSIQDEAGEIAEEVAEEIAIDEIKKHTSQEPVIKTVFNVAEKGALTQENLSSTIKDIITNKGGELTWIGEIVIDSPIVLNLKEIQGLSIVGHGEKTRLKVKDGVNIDAAMIIDYGNDDLELFDEDQYGARSFKIENLFIDCNGEKGFAKHGLVLGVHHPVVQSCFRMVNIVNSTDYGLILDSTQNSHFEMVNVEQCGGGILLLNGAGNNVFTKCEFDANTDPNLHLISFEERYFKNGVDLKDGDYFSWTDTSPNSTRKRNDFSNTAQMNIFINPVIERFVGDTEIYFGKAINNSFIDAEIHCRQADKLIYISNDSSHNKLSFRMGIEQTEKYQNHTTPIINDGWNTLIYNSYIENCGSEYVVDTSKVIKLQNVDVSNPKDVKLLTERTDEGYAHNIDRNIRYLWKWDYLDKLECGQMAFRDANFEAIQDHVVLKVKDGRYLKLLTEPYTDPYTRDDIDRDREEVERKAQEEKEKAEQSEQNNENK